MAEQKIILEPKLVGNIEGSFYIASYQRGYRWGREEVKRMLDDLFQSIDAKSEGQKNYCLQPIVVRRHPNGDCELIDGQQRLTTIYLIYKYMNAKSGGFLPSPKFSIKYETRPETREFLADINIDRRNENIDFFFICEAYECIAKYFTEVRPYKQSDLTDLNSHFEKYVKVIWYEIPTAESEGEGKDEAESINLFTRLNIGKIPLTSSELVKAMILRTDSDGNGKRESDARQKMEMALQWDNIERELHDSSLWYFLTNNTDSTYQTRIDLILDLVSHKRPDEKDSYYTFFYFDREKKEGRKSEDLLEEISQTYLALKDWNEDHELYHKIGYLITSETMSLQDVYSMSEGKKKSVLRKLIDNKIMESIRLENDRSYEDLSYMNAGDYDKIYCLLLLFNVISVWKNGEKSQWFPFDKFKTSEGKKNRWSIEHIHAQRSDTLKTEKEWREWIRLHRQSLDALDKSREDIAQLIADMDEALGKSRIEKNLFDEIQPRVVKALSESEGEYIHNISNLALLKSGDNAALSNSTFDVKRNEIIRMDRCGQYIPFCTKMVFLKYYTHSSDSQLHFWGEADRNAYMEAINEVLSQYMDGTISLTSMESV